MWRSFHEAFADSFSGEQALRQATEQFRLERFFTYPNFEKSAERCGAELTAAGLSDVEVESFPADGATEWSGWGKMKAWDVSSARLWMTEPRRELLCDWTEVPHCLAMYSGSCEEEAELVAWEGETDVDLQGKIPLTRSRINDVYPQMRELGVQGVVSDFLGTLPGVREPFDIPDARRWENSALRPAQGACWGFMLSPRQGKMLRELLRDSRVCLRAEIQSRNYEGIFKSATGVIKGGECPEEEILFVSHLYEPGANDNASGTGVGLELARSLQAAIDNGTIQRPRRSIRFLFNWEGYGLYAWMHKHEDRIPKILGGINIDEIGVDQVKGCSVLHLFMPPAANPSCVGPLLAHLCGEILSPDIKWKAVADRAEIINDTITSDPHMDVPLPCLIQYPSRNYHSSADTLDTLSTDVMKRIGVLCATHLHLLANAGLEEAKWLSQVVSHHFERDLEDVAQAVTAGRWRFSADRTAQWLAEQSALSAASLQRFGLPASECKALCDELDGLSRRRIDRCGDQFPAGAARKGASDDIRRAESLIPRRLTLGAPKAWGHSWMSAEEQREYREVLYTNNLDMLFHRICYWANGSRTVTEIIDRLEFELFALLADTSISRTSSGKSIQGGVVSIDTGAVLYMVDVLGRGGFLGVGGK